MYAALLVLWAGVVVEIGWSLGLEGNVQECGFQKLRVALRRKLVLFVNKTVGVESGGPCLEHEGQAESEGLK